MLNIEKQIKHWRDGSLEEWEVASELIANKRIRHGLFWAHLALEKMLKAHVCQQTGDIAPRIHNLVRLCELAELSMNPDQVKFLTKINKMGYSVNASKSKTQKLDQVSLADGLVSKMRPKGAVQF